MVGLSMREGYESDRIVQPALLLRQNWGSVPRREPYHLLPFGPSSAQIASLAGKLTQARLRRARIIRQRRAQIGL
jgi:hypothetical protein